MVLDVDAASATLFVVTDVDDPDAPSRAASLRVRL